MNMVQEFDSQLQRSLNYEDYTTAQTIRQKRQTVDEALNRLLVSSVKGKHCNVNTSWMAGIQRSWFEMIRSTRAMQAAWTLWWIL